MATQQSALRLLGFCFGILVASSAVAQTKPVPSFLDKFDRLNTMRWRVSDGWSNGGSFQCTWRSTNVRIQPGGLALSLTERSPGVYNCAEVQSTQKFRFGIFEARLKASTGSGISTAFFLFSNPTNTAPFRDINAGVMGKEATGEFIDLAIVWTEKQITWYQDRKIVREVKAADAEIPQDPMTLVLNAHTRTESWLGPFDPASLPTTSIFERVSYTALGEPCQFPESIACKINLAANMP